MTKHRRYEAPFSEVIETLISSIEESGMVLVADIDVQKNARMKGMEISGNRILEVFRPDYAVKVWEMEIEAGVDIPIRIHVHEEEDGRVSARYRTPLEVFCRYDNDALTTFGAEIDPVFEEIISSPFRRKSSVSEVDDEGGGVESGAIGAYKG